MKKLYIAGKLAGYTPEYNSNKKRMMQVAVEAIHRGYSVFVPCLTDKLAEVDSVEDWGYSRYFDNSQPWLEASDAVLLVPGWEESEGVSKEIDTAKGLGIPIFEDICDMDEYFKQDEIAKQQGRELDYSMLVEGNAVVLGKVYADDFITVDNYG